jgi:hypothetical protein
VGSLPLIYCSTLNVLCNIANEWHQSPLFSSIFYYPKEISESRLINNWKVLKCFAGERRKNFGWTDIVRNEL